MAKVRVGIDLGSTWCSVVFVFLDEMVLVIVVFGQDLQIKSQIAYVHDNAESVKAVDAPNVESIQGGRYVFGAMVDSLISSGKLKEEDRIVLAKVCLVPGERTKGLREQVRIKLKRIQQARGDANPPSLLDIHTLILGNLWRRTKEKMIEHRGGDAEKALDDNDIECAIGVPAMWSAQLCQVIVTAAHRACIPNPDVVSEPEAAVAMYRHTLHPDKASRLFEHSCE